MQSLANEPQFLQLLQTPVMVDQRLLALEYGITAMAPQSTVKEYPATGNTFSGWYLDGIYQGLRIHHNRDYGCRITNLAPSSQETALFQHLNLHQPRHPTHTTASRELAYPKLIFYCASSTASSGFNVQFKVP